ncbi:MAG: hypothetical protein EOM45_09755 [Clostridia bacterium]|nr:hypothetical protein [Clostridia bacterium]
MKFFCYTVAMQYYALIGDLQGSRKSQDRKALQELLQKTLEGLNKRYSDLIAASLMVNAGDAFQGLFFPSAPLLEICDRIRYALLNHSNVRIGIGYGAIDTAIERNLSILCDGPAFWSAKEALSEVVEQDYYRTRTMAFCMSDAHPHMIETLVNQVLVLQDQVSSKWKNTQLELARHYLLTHGFEKVSQTRLAKEMGLSTQQINSTIQAMGWFAFLDTRRETELTLQSVLGELDS